MKFSRSIALLALVTTVSLARGVHGAEAVATVRHAVQTDESGVAIHGYDPVAYFTEGRAVAGSARHQLRWQGAIYQFASDANRAAFQQEPERYAPQYGGFCAWGVAAQDDLFDIDPTAWRIVDEKLYLNYDASVQRTWLGDVAGFIWSADQRWPTLRTATNK